MVPRLSCSGACGIILDQGSNLSSALAGGSFTTEPPDKPWDSFELKTLLGGRIISPGPGAVLRHLIGQVSLSKF